jgi:ribulose 1,5-bisphosphate synthetase/thiazole synthase
MAHADCNTHRQVSLLSIESIDKMRKMGMDLNPGYYIADSLETVSTICSKVIQARARKFNLISVADVVPRCLDKSKN